MKKVYIIALISLIIDQIVKILVSNKQLFLFNLRSKHRRGFFNFNRL